MCSFLAVADGVETIAVSQHNFKLLVFGGEGQARASAGLPTAGLFKTAQVFKMRRGGLPPAEQATRDAIAATKQRELLGQSGETFNLTLLLTQTQALSYAAHLATVTSQNEPQPDHARALAGISEDMKNLEAELFQLLLAKKNPQR